MAHNGLGRASGGAGPEIMNRRFVVTGGPGGGKTTLLNALAARGYRVMPEAARRIIKARWAEGLPPRPDAASFARQILAADVEQYHSVAHQDGSAFFDRGVPDALYMLDLAGGITESEAADLVQRFPYNHTVFLLPPWKKIYGTDAERDQTFDESVAVFEGMKRWYSRWGYQTIQVPRVSIEARVLFVLEHTAGRES